MPHCKTASTAHTFAFQIIRPVISWKKRGFPLTSGRAALTAASRFTFSKAERSIRHLSLVAKSPRIPDASPDKSALGKGWGAWGEGLRERLSFGKAGPSRAGSDRRRPQAVPVATKEATGIDSRDEGFPFPPNNLRIGLTGSRAAAGLSQGRRYRRGRAAAESADQGRTRLPQGGPAAAAWWQAGPA